MYKVLLIGMTAIFLACSGDNTTPQSRPSQQTASPSKTVASEPKAASKDDLPDHKIVSNTSLAPKNGRRIEIHVLDEGLSKSDAANIVEYYRSSAGLEGQVSVHKPSKMMGGTMQPWAVDNLDGSGIMFNDYYFE